MKKAASLFLAMTMIFTLCACTDKEPVPTPTPVPSPVKTEAPYVPVTYKNHGRHTTVYSMPQKILAVGPNCAEVLCALGLSRSVVGKCMVNHSYGALRGLTKAYDAIPILSIGYPTLNEILSSGCDFVYASEWLFTDTLTVKMLEDARISVYVSEASDYEGLWKEIRDLSRIFRVEAVADGILTSEKNRIEKVGEVLKDTEAKSVLVVDSIIGDKIFTAGGPNIETAYIESAGCINAFASLEKPWDAVSVEEIVKAKPDFIIIHDYSGSAYDEKLAALKEHPVLGKLDCVVNGRIIKLKLEDIMPGMRSALTVETVAYTVFYDKFAAPTDAPE